MRKMKDSGTKWIGDIPLEWQIRRLRFLCDISTGNMDTQNNNPEGEYPFYVRSPIVERSNEYTFDNEAVLMAGDGVGAGKVFHYVNGKYGCHQRVYSMSNFSEITGKYLYYYLLENFYKKIEESNAKSTVDSVRLPMLKDFPVVFPSTDEQEKIVEYLDEKCSKIDAIIARQEEIIEKLKEYKLSIITKAVTKGINPDGEMKDTGIEWIGKIPVSWNIVKGHRIIVTTQNGMTRRDLEKSNGQIVLKLKNINTEGYIDYSDINRIELTDSEIEKYRLVDKDFLFVRVNGSRNLVGKCAIYRDFGECVAYNDHIIRVKLNGYCVAEYFQWYLQSAAGKREIDMHINTAAGQYTISGEGLRDLTVVLPSIQEQNEINSFLNDKCDRINSVIENKVKLINGLKIYRQSLIYEVVTGKKEV